MTRLRESTDSLREALLPELELIRRLGAGATSEVFLAREPALQRLVAVKVLRPELAEDAVVRQRFQREAQSAARIAHPHVTTIYRTGCTPDQRPFIVMEYVEGRTLADVLDAGALEPAEARPLLAAIAGALAAAHARGIIHRDVRPGNILVENRTGRAVLGDFGIAALLETGSAAATRLTSAGVVLGDMRYRSPEQLRGEDVVEQSDVYAFGLLAFEVLAGRSPYHATTPTGWMTAHLSQTPADLRELCPAAGDALAALVTRCLAREPARRPLAAELVTRLEGPAEPGPDGHGAVAMFLAELKRRRVYQVMAAYTAGTIALIGLLADVSDAIAISIAGRRTIVVVALAGFPVAFLLAWVYDVRAGGIERTRAAGEAGPTRTLMWAGAAGALVIALLAGWLLLR